MGRTTHTQRLQKKKDYLNVFLEYCDHAKDGETRPTATVQTYVLAKHNDDINRMIHKEFMELKALMKRCLVSSFWEEVKDEDTEFMMA